MPGTRSCFWRNSGTQNEWITSFDVIRSTTDRWTGRRSTADFLFPYCGYEYVHANCWAITSTRSGFAPAASFFARTTALTIAIAVTSTVGIAVQTISRPVCPWIGGPSVSSSGFRRNLKTAYADTEATIAKMKMQIPVTNQKTKSIRPASFDAGVGSQPGTSASVSPAADATAAKRISWTIEPLRTDGNEST